MQLSFSRRGFWSRFRIRWCVGFWVSFLGVCSLSGAELSGTFRGATVLDEVYEQDVNVRHGDTTPLNAVVVWKGEVWGGHAGGVGRWTGITWDSSLSAGEAVLKLREAGGKLWAVGAVHLWKLEGDRWEMLKGEGARDVLEFRGEVWVVMAGNLYKVGSGMDLTALTPLSREKAPFDFQHAVVHRDSLVVLGSGRMTHWNLGRWGGLDTYGFPSDQALDWGEWGSRQVREVVSGVGALWLATERGLGRVRGMTLEHLGGREGLPVETLISLAAGWTNDLWVGTVKGLVRHVEGKWHYYAGQRWLPGDEVRDIAVVGRRVYCATDRGLGEIRFEPYTLQKKAGYYEKWMEKWGMKRLGFTHKLETDDGVKGYVREVSDNDGGYTGDYLAAQSYRWAVTRDPVAKREASNTFQALRWLERMTGIPGFPARAVWAKGEVGHKSAQGSGGYPAEWHDTADGLFEWKGDTSSDEICSHFYSIGLFLELAAEGEEAVQAKAHLGRLAKHLLDHEWKLVDVDGKPTRWGRWDPDYFKTDEGRFDRGLQALEVLSFMKTAHYFTGDKQFEDAYQRLVKMGYPEFTLRQRSTFPPEDMAHFEDQLAFWCWWNLIRFETNPDLKAFYRRGYERSFETVRVEHNPWYSFLFGALMGGPCEEKAAVDHLREWPLDLRVWSFSNSHRADDRTPDGYRTYKGGVRAFSPREREPMRWDAWAMHPDGGNGGRSVMEAGSWLLAYWMGRYHGMISEPRSGMDAERGVKDEEIPEGGAAAYAGPARPEVP